MSGTESGAVELIPLNIPKSVMSLMEGAALFVLVLALALLEGPWLSLGELGFELALPFSRSKDSSSSSCRSA